MTGTAGLRPTLGMLLPPGQPSFVYAWQSRGVIGSAAFVMIWLAVQQIFCIAGCYNYSDGLVPASFTRDTVGNGSAI